MKRLMAIFRNADGDQAEVTREFPLVLIGPGGAYLVPVEITLAKEEPGGAKASAVPAVPGASKAGPVSQAALFAVMGLVGALAAIPFGLGVVAGWLMARG